MRRLFLTWFSFVKHWMVFLLFPPVAAFASRLILASFMILGNKSTRLPIFTDLVRIILKDIRLTSKVLPIVRIYALCLVVVLIERTPFCLEIKHIEVSILLHVVNQPRLQLFRVVCK